MKSLGISALIAFCMLSAATGAEDATQILSEAGVQGGLVVHLGCGDGSLTAALRASDAYLVHGLDVDPKNVDKSRRHLQSLDLYGKVSVERWDADTLPYADNLVKLLVAEDLGRVPMAAVLRVLAPLGVACIKRPDGQWAKTVKPWPEELDEWTVRSLRS